MRATENLSGTRPRTFARSRRSRFAPAPPRQIPPPLAHRVLRSNANSRPLLSSRSVIYRVVPDCSRLPLLPHPEYSAWIGSSVRASQRARQGNPAKNSAKSRRPRLASDKSIGLHRRRHKHFAWGPSTTAAGRTARDLCPDTHRRGCTGNELATSREPRALLEAAALIGATGRQNPERCFGAAIFRRPQTRPRHAVRPGRWLRRAWSLESCHDFLHS